MIKPIGFYKDKEGRTRPITRRKTQPRIVKPKKVWEPLSTEFLGRIAGIDFWLRYMYDGRWDLIDDKGQVIGVYKSRASALRRFRLLEKEARKEISGE
jgi:hypothetical protein